MRKLAVILLLAGAIVILSYVVGDLAVKQATSSSDPTVGHEIGNTIWSWCQTIYWAVRDLFSAFFLKAQVPVAVKGAGAAMMLAVLLLIYSQMFGKSSSSSGRTSKRSTSRYQRYQPTRR